jgi:hypothetical protein
LPPTIPTPSLQKIFSKRIEGMLPIYRGNRAGPIRAGGIDRTLTAR